MATPKKSTTASPRKRQTPKRTSSGAGSANGRAPKSSARSTKSRRTNASRTPQASSSPNGASSARTTQRAAAARNGVSGKLRSVGGDVLHAVDRGAKPALAIGATAAGIVGGIALSRRQRSTVLGIPVPHGTDGIDVVAISRAVGKASLQLGQTAKNLSKDIDHAAERAEKIGKILS